MPPTKKPARRIVAQDPLTDAIEPDDDADDERPEPQMKAAANGEGAIRGGWTDAQRQMDSTSSFAQTLKLEEKSIFIKFMDDLPYANFRRHWIERSTKEGKSLRAYTCLKTIDKDCPLCDGGDRASAVAAFNVALIGDDGQLLLKSWDCGPRLYNVLKGYANDPKIGPLSRGFFMVSKTGKRGTTQHNVSPIRGTSLEEDYDITPPTQEEIAALGKNKYGPEIIEIPTVKTLREVAAELDDYDG
jgi:hypothetical protein